LRGLFIVFEGLDGSGKTTLIKEILNLNPESFVYSRGIASPTLIGKIAKKLPSTFMFTLELFYLTFSKIRPLLKKGKIVLQDRYSPSIITYIPKARRWYNKLIIRIFRPFLLKPHLFVYLHIPQEERIERLKKDNNKYHQILIRNPKLIQARDSEYMKIFLNLNGEKLFLRTDVASPQELASRVLKLITRIEDDNGHTLQFHPKYARWPQNRQIQHTLF
jgi:dTMP kinase